MKPLLDLLEIDNNIFAALVNIYYGGFSGWKILVPYLSYKRANLSGNAIEHLLNMIDWTKLQTTSKSQAKDSYLSLNLNCSRFSLLSHDYVNDIFKILDIMSVERAKQYKIPQITLPSKVGPLRNIMLLVKGIFDKNMFQILKNVDSLKAVLGIENNNVIELFEAFTLLLQNSTHSVDIENALTQPQLQGAIQTMINFLISLIKDVENSDALVDVKKKKNKMIMKIEGMIESVFGAVYNDSELFIKGARKLNTKMRIIFDILKNLSEMKKLKKNLLVKIMRLPDGVSLKIQKTLSSLLNILESIFTETDKYETELYQALNPKKAEGIGKKSGVAKVDLVRFSHKSNYCLFRKKYY